MKKMFAFKSQMEVKN